jgi:hypothetical protein
LAAQKTAIQAAFRDRHRRRSALLENTGKDIRRVAGQPSTFGVAPDQIGPGANPSNISGSADATRVYKAFSILYLVSLSG